MINCTDCPDVIATLGDGPELNAEQSKLLTILLNPVNDPWGRAKTVEDMLEELQTFTGHDIDESGTVAAILREHYQRSTGRLGEFDFDHIRDVDGVVNSYNVLTATDSAGTWLAASADSKYLFGDRYGLSGLRAALHIAETLIADHERISRHPGVSEALNRAADDVTELHPEGQLARDTANLVVNAALHYLENPQATLDEAIEANYDEPVDDVLAHLSDS